MKLTPTPGRVLIKAEIPEDISEGGIILPEDRDGDPKDNPQFGIVMAVGPPTIKKNGKKIPMPVKKGERVIFKDFYHTVTGIVNAFFVDQNDIIAVIEG